MGLESELFARIEGVSGEVHTVPLYVNSKPAVIIDMITKDFLDERYLLGVALRAVDIPHAMVLLVLPADAGSSLEKIFNPERVKVIRVDSFQESVDKVLDEILALVSMKKHEGP